MQQAAQKQDIFTSWISWHFFETPKFLFEVWNNYFNYAANFFSFTLLLKTFFRRGEGSCGVIQEALTCRNILLHLFPI